MLVYWPDGGREEKLNDITDSAHYETKTVVAKYQFESNT